MVMVPIVAVAIAIGVGVVIWRHRQHGSHSSSLATRCGFRADRAYSWLTIIACQARTQSVLTSPVLHSTFLLIHLWQF